ncbi:hypothetical protein QWZ03_04290 [Chitinimonas viridis]|uniref:Uncharacterized protein n=1 Tax=Chitinimonas viridis TaxID=664880 RepID=A0ABT8B2X2_9NEIS|nr:hypothetical protein [Chitinimonas viridis]MDN3575986.1 hypothetical protein [Chitinimonas viridis]
MDTWLGSMMPTSGALALPPQQAGVQAPTPSVSAMAMAAAS